jgi:zinc protease
VVIEEWRTGRGAQARVQNRQLPVLLKGSLYAERIPIGTRENLETVPDSLVRRFYRDWYRPDLMTVVAVGDFDAPQMEAAIRARFSRLAMPASPRPRTYASVPGHDEPLVSIATDPEYPASSVALLWLRPVDTTRTVGDLRRGIVAGFYDAMLNARFAEQSQRPDAPFAFASSGRSALVRTRGSYVLVAGVKESGFARAAEALLAEAERVARQGFTQPELDRVRTNYLRSREQAYAERDRTSSGVFASRYVGSALTGAPIVSIEQDQALAKALAPTIQLAEVDSLARSSFTDRDRVILVAAPAKPEIAVPDPTAMLAVFDKAKGSNIAAYVDSASDAPLVATPPAPGSIVAQRSLPETGIVEWTLSNGARVLLKPTDFKADEVLFAARSPGGTSLLSNRDELNASLGNAALAVSGVGPFNQVALGKRLTGKRAQVSAAVSESEEGMRGSASARDLETLFQLAWLRFTQPRVDSGAYAAFKGQMRAALGNQRNRPEAVFSDTVSATLTQHDARVHRFTPEILDSLDLGRALELYRDRFADASGFTFFLVGSFRPDSVRPLVERYLASLPALHRTEAARDLGIRPPRGVVEKVVRKGTEAKAQTLLVFTGSCRYSYENRATLDALRELLEIRLREVLREEKGGTYGAGVGASCSHIPYPRYQVNVSFGSAPERTDELVAAVFAVIDSIKAGAISDSNLTKIREIATRSHESALTNNGAWLAAMADADQDGRDQRDFLRLPTLIGGITRERLRDAARLYLDQAQYARFTLLPETLAK